MKSLKNILSDSIELTKPRICLLALMMTALGFYCGSGPSFSTRLFVCCLIGTALVGIASGILNQYMERELDARMWRTLNRPLPAGRLDPKVALKWGGLTGVLSVVWLMSTVNSPTAVLGAATLLLYLGVYTPSKKLTPLSTLLGALPGAMPPLMGWTGAHGHLTGEPFILFAILFIWQIPHFLAIAWIYEEDYERASLPMLKPLDRTGDNSAGLILIYLLVLIPLSLYPSVSGLTGSLYFLGATGLGISFLLFGFFLAIYRTKASAHRLFMVSILYLPLLSLLMVWDKVL